MIGRIPKFTTNFILNFKILGEEWKHYKNFIGRGRDGARNFPVDPLFYPIQMLSKKFFMKHKIFD